MKMFECVWKESLDREEECHPSFADWENHQVRSILVIHQGALGDFILGLPALETLRKNLPQARTVIVGYPRILELADQRFYADETISIDRREMASFFVRERPLDPALSRLFNQLHLIVVFGKDEEGTLIGNLKRVSCGLILHIDPFPSWGERVHLTDYLLRQFSDYGFRILESNPRLRLKKSDRSWGNDFWRRKGVTLEEKAKVIILHPGSGSKKKVWPPDRFLSLAQILQNRFGSKILIPFGPAEGSEVEEVFEGMDPRTWIRVKELSLKELASVMEGCRLFIGNDSGISHLASSLGIPTIAIFGPTDPKVWSPRGERVWVVQKEIPCSPCPRDRFLHCIDLECLKGIEIEDVLKGLERLGIEA
jgi:ADP-heptose:LPS heptosyltransferase